MVESSELRRNDSGVGYFYLGYFYQVSYGCEVTKRPSLRRSACFFTLGVKTGACDAGPGAIKVVDRWLRGLKARVMEVNMMGFESHIY